MTTPPAKPNRYELPTTSIAGAMVIVLLVVGGFVAWRGLVRDNSATPIPVVDYKPFVQAGRTEGQIVTFAPTQLPEGARATSATYLPGASPHWHLGVLTAGSKYIGVEESLESVQSQVQQYIGDGARQGADATVAGVVWKTYTDSKGDYGLVRTLPAPGGKFAETLVVGGTASPADVQAFAASLKP